ncbi:hypothetical protein WMY93_022269 [Mugilogobius chulae]|uniref:Dynein axonemal intermediate chain 4 n=1 Tax=Mugilogobius chulae TaxID=88201 RepID=A0AAW0NHQ9_9GOBI
MQTLDNYLKNKSVQTDSQATVEAETLATNWEIYDSMNELTISELENEKAEQTKSLKKGSSHSNTTSTSDSGSSSSSLPEIDFNLDGSQIVSQPLIVMSSKEFLHSLLVIERNVVANIYQSKLASYKELPLLPDPYDTVNDLPEEDQDEEEKEEEEYDQEDKSSDAASVELPEAPAPALTLLWSFSCELTTDCVVTSLSWHKENTDILAVGYDCSAHNMETPGLICVWSLKNVMWPERVIYTRSAVTTLDFSPNQSAHLGVGMMDGTVAIYNAGAGAVQVARKHLEQVCQVSWTKQVLISVSVDGLIKTWTLSPKGLGCSGFKVYLAGTRDGLIHMCSKRYSLETFEKHFHAVNGIEWSPFSPDLFLSGSSDWTVQLWRRDSPSPILGFTSLRMQSMGSAGPRNGRRLNPTEVLSSRHKELTSVQFSPVADTVVVGDSSGEVKVYQLQNFGRDSDGKVVNLEDAI